MIKHDKILVPSDFSDASEEALRRAIKLAQVFNAEVHLLHVIEPLVPLLDMESVPMLPDEDLNQAIHDQSRLRLAKLQANADYPLITHLHESPGNAANFICEFAGEQDIDLIVIGRQGSKGFLEHFLMGSTAEQVVRYAPCSVLVSMPHGLLAD